MIEVIGEIVYTLVIGYIGALELCFVAKKLYHLGHKYFFSEKKDLQTHSGMAVKESESKEILGFQRMNDDDSYRDDYRVEEKLAKQEIERELKEKASELQLENDAEQNKIETSKTNGCGPKIKDVKDNAINLISEKCGQNVSTNGKELQTKQENTTETQFTRDESHEIEREEQKEAEEKEEKMENKVDTDAKNLEKFVNNDDIKTNGTNKSINYNSIAESIQNSKIAVEDCLASVEIDDKEQSATTIGSEKLIPEDPRLDNVWGVEETQAIKTEPEYKRNQIAVTEKPTSQIVDTFIKKAFNSERVEHFVSETTFSPLPPMTDTESSADEEENSFASVIENKAWLSLINPEMKTNEETKEREKINEVSKSEQKHVEEKIPNHVIILSEEEKERIINLNEDDVQFKDISDVLKSAQLNSEDVIDTPLNEYDSALDEAKTFEQQVGANENFEHEPDTKNEFSKDTNSNEKNLNDSKCENAEGETEERNKRSEKNIDETTKLITSEHAVNPTIELFNETGEKSAVTEYGDGLSPPATTALNIMESLNDFYDFNASRSPSRSRSVSRSSSVFHTSGPTTPDISNGSTNFVSGPAFSVGSIEYLSDFYDFFTNLNKKAYAPSSADEHTYTLNVFNTTSLELKPPRPSRASSPNLNCTSKELRVLCELSEPSEANERTKNDSIARNYLDADSLNIAESEEQAEVNRDFIRSKYVGASTDYSYDFEELREQTRNFVRSRSPSASIEEGDVQSISLDDYRKEIQINILKELESNSLNGDVTSFKNFNSHPELERRESDSALIKKTEIIFQIQDESDFLKGGYEFDICVDNFEVEPEEYHHFRRFSMQAECQVEEYPSDERINRNDATEMEQICRDAHDEAATKIEDKIPTDIFDNSELDSGEGVCETSTKKNSVNTRIDEDLDKVDMTYVPVKEYNWRKNFKLDDDEEAISSSAKNKFVKRIANIEKEDTSAAGVSDKNEKKDEKSLYLNVDRCKNDGAEEEKSKANDTKQNSETDTDFIEEMLEENEKIEEDRRNSNYSEASIDPDDGIDEVIYDFNDRPDESFNQSECGENINYDLEGFEPRGNDPEEDLNLYNKLVENNCDFLNKEEDSSSNEVLQIKTTDSQGTTEATKCESGMRAKHKGSWDFEREVKSESLSLNSQFDRMYDDSIKDRRVSRIQKDYDGIIEKITSNQQYEESACSTTNEQIEQIYFKELSPSRFKRMGSEESSCSNSGSMSQSSMRKRSKFKGSISHARQIKSDRLRTRYGIAPAIGAFASFETSDDISIIEIPRTEYSWRKKFKIDELTNLSLERRKSAESQENLPYNETLTSNKIENNTNNMAAVQTIEPEKVEQILNEKIDSIYDEALKSRRKSRIDREFSKIAAKIEIKSEEFDMLDKEINEKTLQEIVLDSKNSKRVLVQAELVRKEEICKQEQLKQTESVDKTQKKLKTKKQSRKNSSVNENDDIKLKLDSSIETKALDVEKGRKKKSSRKSSLVALQTDPVENIEKKVEVSSTDIRPIVPDMAMSDELQTQPKTNTQHPKKALNEPVVDKKATNLNLFGSAAPHKPRDDNVSTLRENRLDKIGENEILELIKESSVLGSSF